MLDIIFLNRHRILEKSQSYFYQNIPKNSNIHNLKIGCELEFFLLDHNHQKITNPLLIREFCAKSGCKMEQGEGQIEIVTNYINDLSMLARQIDDSKQQLISLAHFNNYRICFDSKPFMDDCGSALQFNISLHDDMGNNLFNSQDQYHQFIATGLLDLTNYMLILLAPMRQDYRRFDVALNKELFKAQKYSAPVNLSFGNDNRTCAIRFCKSTNVNDGRRLEYRVASANCDVWLALSVIVLAISYGLNNQHNSYPKIFGNAFDGIYNIPKIVNNIDDAEHKFFLKENFILEKIYQFIN